MSTTYTIGQMSQASGVNLETIRYYERTGLLPEPPRSASGYRRYSEDDVRRLRFVRRGRELGFSIAEVKELLRLADHPDSPCQEADQLVREHLVSVEARIRDLLALRDELSRLAGCHSDNAEHCRLIETLDQRECCGPFSDGVQKHGE